MKEIIIALIVLASISIIGFSIFDTSTNQKLDELNVSNNNNYTYPIVDTAQGTCYNNNELIDCPSTGEEFYGQDAQYTGNEPNYTDNGDGTISDNVTNLIWSQDLSESSMAWSEASNYCESLEFADISDWRLPNIKELWSIRDFSQGWPWVNTDYFYLVGDGTEGAQQHSWSSNYYLVDTEEAMENIAFVVNDWTGHIKAMDGERFVRCVSGDEYGVNEFTNNNDGTIMDEATGLMWDQVGSDEAMTWEEALTYAENSTYAGYDDWRLPNVKELQSIVDYSGVFPAIDTSMFDVAEITNEAGNDDYAYYWTSTTNPFIDPKEKSDNPGYWFAWYVAFGYAVDHEGNDMHGAGAVRFDSKSEDGADGPDGERYYNYVRLVRGGNVSETPNGNPSINSIERVVSFPDGITDRGGNPGNDNVPINEENLDKPNLDELPSEQEKAPQPMNEDGQQNPDLLDKPNLDELPSEAPQPMNGEIQQGPDLNAAAITLGISEEELIDALGEPGEEKPDFAAVALILGITEAELIDALNIGQ